MSLPSSWLPATWRPGILTPSSLCLWLAEYQAYGECSVSVCWMNECTVCWISSFYLHVHPLLFFTLLWSLRGWPADDISGLVGPLASGWVWPVAGSQNGRGEGICPTGSPSCEVTMCRCVPQQKVSSLVKGACAPWLSPSTSHSLFTPSSFKAKDRWQQLAPGPCTVHTPSSHLSN